MKRTTLATARWEVATVVPGMYPCRPKRNLLVLLVYVIVGSIVFGTLVSL